MPGLVRKLLISAGAQGLLLQPVNQRNQPSTSPAVHIDYKSNTVRSSPEHEKHDRNTEELEAHGIVGLLNLASTSYLISISRREQVALIKGKPVYTITDVTLIPLSSQSDAQNAISAARTSLNQTGSSTDQQGSDTEDENETHAATNPDEEVSDDESPVTPVASGETEAQKGLSPLKKGTSVVADVIKDRGKYGRFADRWFSSAGWSGDGRRKQGMSTSVKEAGEGTEEDDLTREQKRQGLESLPDDKTSEPATAAVGKSGSEQEVSTTGDDSAQRKVKTTISPAEGVMSSLAPRIIRTTSLFFASKSFFFSYDYDISRSLSRQDSGTSALPMHKRFDPLFFWNHHLIGPFEDAGQPGIVLPMIQGFVGQRAFSIGKNVRDNKDKIVDAVEKAQDVVETQKNETAKDPKVDAGNASAEREPQLSDADSQDFLLTLISRRSVKRAGLRYLRRGVDDEGKVANAVETEQLLSRQDWNPQSKIFSLVQIRGSIPLFFSQSPYSFKPVPITYGSEETNHAAFKRHFSSVVDRYGDVQVASLVDKHGNEGRIGGLYQKHAEMTNEDTSSALAANKKIGFEWFDFHSECRGMKFENVSLLITTLAPSLSAHSWTESIESRLGSKQRGVLRTNCMDCLDRTNVVQSAVAGHTLQKQLETLGMSIDLQTDPKTSWFNSLWADNGDAISRQYAGTAALKGDYTRTRHRHWTGALADFSLTLNRYYNNIFNDYFLQTCIDYWLGNYNSSPPGPPAPNNRYREGWTLFEEFETDMMTSDYALDMRRVRQSAIETCVKIVLEDPDEDLISGWTLATPRESNTVRTHSRMEECVVLLTDKAVYMVRFDWSTEKVGSFERVPLERIEGVKRGVYVTSTLGQVHLDESKNRGFVITYRPDGERLIRTNTRSLANEKVVDESPANEGGVVDDDSSATMKDKAPPRSAAEDEKTGTTNNDERPRILAFKALPPRAAAAKTRNPGDDTSTATEMSEAELVDQVTSEIHRLAVSNSSTQTEAKGADGQETSLSSLSSSSSSMWKIEDADIISASEAKRGTTYLETLGYSLKKLVWS